MDERAHFAPSRRPYYIIKIIATQLKTAAVALCVLYVCIQGKERKTYFVLVCCYVCVCAAHFLVQPFFFILIVLCFLAIEARGSRVIISFGMCVCVVFRGANSCHTVATLQSVVLA